MAEEHEFIVFAANNLEAKEALGAAKNKLSTLSSVQLIDASADSLLVRASRMLLREALQEFQPHVKVEENKPGSAWPVKR